MRSIARLLFASVLLSTLSTAAAFAAVRFVNAAATGSNNGMSWANAYTSLQSALAAATSTDEIWVASGTYKPTAVTDRMASFVLKNGVGVYGGFNGTETLRSQRNPVVNVTTLSGNIGAMGSFHVVTADSSVTVTGVLDGFTISGGQADGANPEDEGGGMRINGGAPSLANLIFTGNAAQSKGAGLRVLNGAPTLLGCSFISNVVDFLGAGGGLFAGAGSTILAQNCVFIANAIASGTCSSGDCGAGLEVAGGNTLINCIVAQNIPTGAQFNDSGNTIENCTFTANTGYGAAFLLDNNTITNTIFWGDSTDEIFLAPGTGSASPSYCDIQNNLFAGTGNIDANPLFRSAPTDLRLGAGSPAVDAGNNAAVPGGVITDLSGLPRFFDDPAVPNTGAGTPPIVDMGARERVPLSVTTPANQTLCAGTAAGFAVTASGAVPLSFRWRMNSSPLSDGGRISGSATSSLTIDAIVTGDAGSYDVIVTDAYGQTVTSAAATLTVNGPAQPVITGPISVPIGSSGNSASVPSHGGSTYAWTLTEGTITAGQGTSQITFAAGPPGKTMSCTVTETVSSCTSQPGSTPIQVDFLDVPPLANFHDAIVKLARNGVTAGCGNGNYCPDQAVTRAQMAVFLLKGEHGSTYVPPACVGIFGDVECMPTPAFAVNSIEELHNESITAGCHGGVDYCPDDAVTRAQMAVFLLKAKHGSSYMPPLCTGVFPDVACMPVPAFAVNWIEELFHESITAGCNGGVDYCPDDSVTRAQMAVFLNKTFGLQ